jgi:hypothetical protein
MTVYGRAVSTTGAAQSAPVWELRHAAIYHVRTVCVARHFLALKLLLQGTEPLFTYSSNQKAGNCNITYLYNDVVHMEYDLRESFAVCKKSVFRLKETRHLHDKLQ